MNKEFLLVKFSFKYTMHRYYDKLNLLICFEIVLRHRVFRGIFCIHGNRAYLWLTVNTKYFVSSITNTFCNYYISSSAFLWFICLQHIIPYMFTHPYFTMESLNWYSHYLCIRFQSFTKHFWLIRVLIYTFSISNTNTIWFNRILKLYCSYKYTMPCMLNRIWGLKQQ